MVGELITLGWMMPWRTMKVALQSEKSRNGLQNPLVTLFHLGHATAQVGWCFKRNNSCFAARLPNRRKSCRRRLAKNPAIGFSWWNRRRSQVVGMGALRSGRRCGECQQPSFLRPCGSKTVGQETPNVLNGLLYQSLIVSFLEYRIDAG